MSPNTAREHIPSLDGIRACAVLMVIVFHELNGTSVHGSLQTAIARLAYLGHTGVDLFFVLSGFLITGILLRSRGSDKFLTNFYIRRFLRIFPLYYAFLIFDYAVGRDTVGSRWPYWIYLQNVWSTFKIPESGPGHFWSLAVEEHFYLIWPLLVMKFEGRKLKAALWIIISFAALIRIALIAAGYDPIQFTFARMDALAIGAMIAVYSSERPLIHMRRPALTALAIGISVAVVMFLTLHGEKNFAAQIIRYPLVASIYGLLIILATSASPSNLAVRALSMRLPCSIGKYSYAMYVFHVTVAHFVSRLGIAIWLQLATVIVLTYAVGWLSWQVLEGPCNSLKGRFEYKASQNGKPIGCHATVQLLSMTDRESPVSE
jgi:peptidoglycan/LPS O-acetylase OafA/YrhL